MSKNYRDYHDVVDWIEQNWLKSIAICYVSLALGGFSWAWAKEQFRPDHGRPVVKIQCAHTSPYGGKVTYYVKLGESCLGEKWKQ